MNRPLVIYHAGCRDGFCAAWVCHLALRDSNPEFFPGFYGQAPPDVTGRDVVLVDFSYPIEIMKSLCAAAFSVVVLDHHKTSQAALAELQANPPANTKIVFDMQQSGAGLTWRHFFGHAGPRPFLVDYVEDRDLWRHALPDSQAINAYISTLPFEFSAWSAASTTSVQDTIELRDPLYTVRLYGNAVIAKIKQYVAEVRNNAIYGTFAGFPGIPVVNAPQIDISELLSALCEDDGEHGKPAFALGWFRRGDGMFQYSLRSSGDFDVSVLAKKYGGGGHKNAAGFQLPNLIV